MWRQASMKFSAEHFRRNSGGSWTLNINFMKASTMNSVLEFYRTKRDK